MAAHAGGDPAAFRSLFERHAPRLLNVLTRQVGSRDAARDLVQQTFLNVHRARHDFRPGTGFRPWLYTIAFNLVRDRYRRGRRKPEVAVDPADQDLAADAEAVEHDPLRDAAVRRALATLPDGQREVIVLHWFEELDFRTIGRIVGASLSAVKVRAHRGYARLRAELGEVWDQVPRNAGNDVTGVDGGP